MTLHTRRRFYSSLILLLVCLGVGLDADAQRRAGQRKGRAPRRAAPAPAAEDARAAPHVEEGLRLAEAGDWEGAIKAFRQAVAASPRHPEAHVHLGDAYMNAGRYEDAFAAYRQAVHVAPWNPDAHYSLGTAFNDMAQYGDAFKPFVQAIQLDPSFAEAHYGIGYAYQKLDNFREALGYLRSALRLRPDYPEARLSLGLTYAGLGDFKAAEEQLRQLEASDAGLAKSLRAALQLAAADASAQVEVRRETPATAAQKPRPTPNVEKPSAAVSKQNATAEKQTATAEQQRAPAEKQNATAERQTANVEKQKAPARRESLRPTRSEAARAESPATSNATRPAAPPIAVELAFWDSIKNSTDPEEFAAYLKRFPEGQFTDLARIRQRALGGRPTAPGPESKSEAKTNETHADAAATGAATPPASVVPNESASAPATDAAREQPSRQTNMTPSVTPTPAGSLTPAMTSQPQPSPPTNAKDAAPSPTNTTPVPSPTNATPANASSSPTPAASSPPSASSSSSSATPTVSPSPQAAETGERAQGATPNEVAANPVVGLVEPARPLTLEETLEWLRNNFQSRFAYRYTVRGEDPSAAPSTREARVSYEPLLFQGCNLEWRDAEDTLSVSLSELDPQGLKVEPRAEPNTTYAAEVWNLVLSATGGARAFRELKGDGSGAMNSYHAVTLQFDSRERAERLAEKLRHAVRLCGGKSSSF